MYALDKVIVIDYFTVRSGAVAFTDPVPVRHPVGMLMLGDCCFRYEAVSFERVPPVV